MVFQPFRSAALRLLLSGAAVLWLGAASAPAHAQNGIATPPEVTVNLDVLDSLGSPPRRRPVVLHPPRDRAAADAPAPKAKPKQAAKKPKPPAKKAAVKRKPETHAETKRPSHANEEEPASEADLRAARAEAQWEADRKREEASHKRPEPKRESETARIKREEAERMREARAEIAEAAKSAPPRPTKSTAKIVDPGPGPDVPPTPAPRVAIESSQPVKVAPKPPQIAAVTPPPSSPPPAPVRAKPAAIERTGAGAPRIEFSAGTADLTQGARTELDDVAKRLVASEDKRVQLIAYASGSGDESNQARRLSLSRALNVRAYLIDHGVHNTRMDVRALGNRSDGSKQADRVDILFLDK